MVIGLLFYLKYDFNFYLRRILFPPSVQQFAEQVFSALNKIHSDVKHLSEVHVAIYSILFYSQQMAQKFIMAMQLCFEGKTQTKG